MNRECVITNFYHLYDLPDDVTFDGDLAVDTEAMGLNNLRDRLCVVQISDGKGDAHVVHFPTPDFRAPNLRKWLSDKSRTKLFHFARFDVALIKYSFDILCEPVYCTKIASKLARTYTDRHGFKELCKELLQIDISKQKQSSDWGAAELCQEQIDYAASDVLYLHQLADTLDTMLKREGRLPLSYSVYKGLSARVLLDLEGWIDTDIYSHS